MNIGLKLWSTNTDVYLEEARKLYADGVFQYIELYIVPETLDSIEKWKTLDIPFTLHAPHFMHGVNLAKESHEEYNKKQFVEVVQFYTALDAGYVIVHSGIDGNIEETARQLNLLQKGILSNIQICIENKPFKALPNKMNGEYCRGATIEEIQDILCAVQCNFCLDVGHAICSANSQGIEPYFYVEQFAKLMPHCYHLSDNDITSTEDAHKHFGEGTIDFIRIFGMINKGKNIAIETKKNNKENLNDFIGDVEWLRTVLE